MTGQIFISYRREESRWSARSLCDRLVARFDQKHIFMDVDSIALGDDFIKEIEKRVGDCDVLIAVIGAHWLTSKDDQGSRRIDNPEDFVHMEIATALRHNIWVIPVLVDGALMPLPRDLPDDLKPLVRRNALQVSDTRFDDDCRRLIAAIEQVLEGAKAEQRVIEEKERLEAEREKEQLQAEQREQKERLEKEAHLTGSARELPRERAAPVPPREEKTPLLQTPKGRRILAANAGVAIAVVTLVMMLRHTTTPTGQVNLLAPENGGKIIRAPNDSWGRIIDGDDDTGIVLQRFLLDGGHGGEAVFGFKDDRFATFDTFTVFIPGPAYENLKDFELLAGSESPTGRFELIGKFSTENIRVMQLREGRLQAHQEFHFAPVKAKYVKIRLLSNYWNDTFFRPTNVSEFRLFGKLN